MLNKKFLLLIMLFTAGSLLAQMEGEPCNVPPFLAQKVTPNILIIMDNSGSMGGPAYWEDYNPNRRYYGYFDPDKVYEYDGNAWVPVNNSADYYTYWPGNVLNWAVMSRMSVLKKVLVGGKAEARSPRGFAHTLLCESRYSWTRYATLNGRTYAFYVVGGSPSSLKIYWLEGGDWDRILSAQNRVEIDSTFSRGVIQKLGDKDMDGRWDDDAPRFWLINFNAKGNGRELDSLGRIVYTGSDNDGGFVSSYYQDNSSMSDFVNAVRNTDPETWTPLAECLLETVAYFQQNPQPYFYNNDYKTGTQWDPMGDPRYWCRKSFVLLLTDGEATRDKDPVLQQVIGDYDRDGLEPNFTDSQIDPYSGHYLDDAALYMHVNDLRPNIPGTQNLTLYSVFVFGRGHSLLAEASKDGGFIDYNGNNRPDLQKEWDANNDGVPDTYYEAENGEDIERAIEAAILDIMRRVSSATAASVISQTQRGEGTMYQAFFQPSYFTSGGELTWIGEVGAYFVDKNGNLREDTDQDGKLDSTDYIIKFKVEGNETKAERYAVSNDMSYRVDEVDIWDVNFLWRAGKGLLDKQAGYRNIKAIIPSGSGYSLVDFTTSQRSKFQSYLGVSGTVNFIDSLINYVRGVDYQNPYWRYRTFEPGKVWKLGDIVYSTPTYVGKPTERYDLIYDDLSYREFYSQKKDRRNILLVGANDGMLHAFNAGIFDTLNRKVGGLGKPLGDELWAVIPMNLLPHLKWLRDPQYCHVYYVDLKPKVTDVRIFSNDRDHPEGWGTVAIVGMRFGGTPITISSGTFTSSYFALDISNPDNPAVLWEFTDPDLGYTISYPSVLKVVEGEEEKWFVVFGSGTNTTPTGHTSTKHAYFYVLDLKSGQMLRKIEIPYPNNQTLGAFCGNPISVDVKLDYSVDVVYLPVTYIEKSGNTTIDKGALYRIVINNSIDPLDWQLSMAFQLDAPLTSGAAASMDEYGNLWVFFGSGKYFTDADETDTRTNYFVGFKDNYWNGGWNSQTSPSYTLSNLLDATNIKVKIDTSGAATVENIPGMGNLSFQAFVDSVNLKYKGWYVKLLNGEKSLNFPLVLGGAVLFTTYRVNPDPCGFGGEGWLYVLFYKTGTAYSNAPLGLTEQREAITKEKVEGMPASPAVQIGSREEATAFVQTSTGEVVQIQTELPFSPKSGARIWRPANF
ncbi:MAG: PilC/PilY family type IV pilus protein [bacterium]|nr:PilC/PilY family type IV pilus protein [bacterium]